MSLPGRLRSRWAALQRATRVALGRTQSHRVGHHSIRLPAEHLLPQYQRAHPRYDRFLPHLAAVLAADDVVVDVGANCGDTLVAMASANAALEFICIEPDAAFFACLQSNAALLPATTRVHALRALVGALVGSMAAGVVLQGSGGTRAARPGAEGEHHTARTLDDIVQGLGSGVAQRVRLVKSDVDGWDHDVIASARQLIAATRPLLYFECQFDNAEQHAGYAQLVTQLFASGYVCAFAFDNFGGFMQRCDSAAPLLQLFSYLWQQNCGRSTRTLHYFDVLMCSAADLALCERAVQGHVDDGAGTGAGAGAGQVG